ncbi:MAG: ABC transporter substrate-binding protein [Pseudomonadota bacterium]
MKMTSAVNLVVILCCLVMGLACHKSDTSIKDQQTLKVAIAMGPLNLDPRVASDAEGTKICKLLFDGLFARDASSSLIPNLALKYELEGDTVYKFYLRPGVKFHSGSSFTAQDVLYTYQSIINGKLISPYRESFARIKKMEALDAYTVLIELKEPYAPFLTLLTMGIVSHLNPSQPIGTGVYKLKHFEPDTVVELEANPDYFGHKPKLQHLNFQVIKDDNVRVLKLVKGEVDLVQNGIPALLIPSLVKKYNLKMLSDDGINMTYLGINLTDDILKHKKVRQALAYALNRDEIINHRFDGLAKKANSLLPPSNWAYDKNLGQYEYDPRKARKLLDEAGFKRTAKDKPRFALSQKTSTLKERVDIAKMIAYQLSLVGINSNVQSYEWGTFYRDVKTGNFQLYTLAWVGITEPDFFYDVCHSSQFSPEGVNRDRYSNPEVDKLVAQARITLDQEKRKQLYIEVQQILFEDLPFIPLWYEKNVVVYQPNLKGVSLRPDASYQTFVNISKK